MVVTRETKGAVGNGESCAPEKQGTGRVRMSVRDRGAISAAALPEPMDFDVGTRLRGALREGAAALFLKRSSVHP